MVCNTKTVFLLVGTLWTLTSGLFAAPITADEIDNLIELQSLSKTGTKSKPADLMTMAKWNTKDMNGGPPEDSVDVVWPKRAAPDFNPSGWRRKRSVNFDEGDHSVAFKELLEKLTSKLETQRGINRRGKPNFNPSGWRKKRSSQISYSALARFARDLVRGSRLRVKRQEEPQFNPSGW